MQLMDVEFEEVIQEKSENFVGREFVFSAINDFLYNHNQGYFTIVGSPGSGKSAILAQYVMQNPHVVYYNAQVEGKNRAEQFLTTICRQLVETLRITSLHQMSENVTENSWFLSLLLQKISDNLEPKQQLIIAIDALDAIDTNCQALGSNLFYLPRYLPEQVYFLLTRRPFLKEQSGLLIETPSQTLDLAEYPKQNREDIQFYIQQYLTLLDLPPTSLTFPGRNLGTRRSRNLGTRRSRNLGTRRSRNLGTRSRNLGTRTRGSYTSSQLKRAGENLKFWLTAHKINQQEFYDRLTIFSENNFMFLSQIISAIVEGFYPEPFDFIETLREIPPTLKAYYQQHWQKMKGQGLSSVALGVIQTLAQHQQPMSVEAIASILNEDEYEVEEVLENWLEFLQQQKVDGEIHYSFYHSNFRNWIFTNLSQG